MTECPNGDIRDLLPDLLHGRLGAGARREVEAHLAACVACAAELGLLRALRDSMSSAASIDARRIAAAALQAGAGSRLSPRAARVSAWRVRRWQAAAAAGIIALGGAAAYLARSAGERVPDDEASVAAPRLATSPASSRSDSLATTRRTDTASTPDAEPVALAVSVSELGDADLEALMRDLDQLDGVPEVEPSAVIAPILDETSEGTS